MELLKGLTLLLMSIAGWYFIAKNRLYRQKSFFVSQCMGFLVFSFLFIIGSVLLSFNHWFATTVFFFLGVGLLINAVEVFKKGNVYFEELDQLAAEKNKKSERQKSRNTLQPSSFKQADKPVSHTTVFKNNRHQKRARANRYTANEIRQIAFTYTDYNGNITYREIAVNRFDGFKINAYCLDKNANRTFNISNVIGNIILRETGEQVEPDEWSELWVNQNK